MHRLLFFILGLTLLAGCNKWPDRKTYQGKQLHKLVTMTSHETIEGKDYHDTLHLYVDKAGFPTLMNNETAYSRRSQDTLWFVGTYILPKVNNHYQDSLMGFIVLKNDLVTSYDPVRGPIVQFEYDSQRRLIKAHHPLSDDTYTYEFKWKGNLLTEVIKTGGYCGDSTHYAIIYEPNVPRYPNAGIAALLDGTNRIFFSKNNHSNSLLLAGYIGAIPDLAVKEIILTGSTQNIIKFANRLDKNGKLQSYQMTMTNSQYRTKRIFDD
uniref:DUF4595 domain-containing protein n=1 Tax=Prevotella sp. GTC17259 TaxID=3236795 RepID=A0AB33J029_9BACT